MGIMSPKKTIKIFILISVIIILIFSIITFDCRSKEHYNELRKQFEDARMEIGKEAEYAIIGEILKEGKVYFIERESLDDLLTVIELKPMGAMACGYDYFIKIYRKKSPNLNIDINTECDYFTIADKEKSYDFGFNSNFFVFSGEFRKKVLYYIKELNKSKKYLYVIKSPISNKFEDLKKILIQDEGFKVLKPDAAPGELNPCLILNYVDRASKYPNLNKDEIFSTCHFGRFEPDKIFNEILNHEYLKNKIVLISNVYYRGSSSNENDHFFKREIKVYIQGDLPDKPFEHLKNIWLKNNQDRCNEFLKFEIEFIRDNFYFLEIISDQLIDQDGLDRIVKKYNLIEIFSR